QRSIFGGDFVGKYAFASPEHFSGNVERRSDIYSLGLVLATAAIGHGQRLKMGSSLTEMTLARQKLPDMAPVPEELRHEIAAMLQPLPENRPQGMYDIVDPEVRKWHLDRETTELAGDGVSRKILIGIGVCVGVLVVLAAGHVIYPRPLLSLLGIRTHVVASEIQHRVDAALRCKSASVAVSQNYMFRTEATLTGIVANQDDSKMATALASGPKIDRVANQLKIEPWPFCDVIEMARAVDGDAGARVLPAIDGGAKDFVFHENQFLRLTVDASSLFNGYLYVDYFDPDGNVMHMLPNGRRKVNKVTAGQKVTIGNAYNKEKYAGYTCNSPARRDDAADYTYQICSPFGKDMIMAISSPRPLFPKPRQVTETAAAYLSALRKVMAHPRSPADAPVISYRIMTTQPAASPARPQ
ncbi:MAG: DUF4384 domain-containing protein, partial [Gemmataceae bacterium]